MCLANHKALLWSRLRDPALGSNPFGDPREQGILTGHLLHPNEHAAQGFWAFLLQISYVTPAALDAHTDESTALLLLIT